MRGKRGPSPASGRARRPAYGGRVELLSNACEIVANSRFRALHVLTVAISGPRPLTYRDERFKNVLIGHREFRSQLPRPHFVDLRDEHGVKLYVAEMDGGDNVTAALSKLEAVEVLVKRRATDEQGEDEAWQITCQAVHGSPIRNPVENPTLFVQWLNFVCKAVLTETCNFSSLQNDTRLVKLSGQERARELRSLKGRVLAAFRRNIICTNEGHFMALFSPCSSLVLDGSLSEYLPQLAQEACSGYRSPRQRQFTVGDMSEEQRDSLVKALRRKGVTVSTKYSPNNVYAVVGLPKDILPTSPTELTIKTSANTYQKKQTTYIDYLRECYGAKCRQLQDRSLDESQMVAIAMMGKGRKTARSSRIVFVPAPLLQVINVSPADLTQQTRAEITRLSQKKASETFSELDSLLLDLSRREVQEAFDTYGVTVRSQPTRLHGRNNVASIITINVPAGGGRDRGVTGGKTELVLDDQCSFLRSFTHAMHSQPPTIRTWMLLIFDGHRGGCSPDMARHMMDDLHRAATARGWRWQYSFKDGWTISWQREDDLLNRVPDILKKLNQKVYPRPDVVFSLIPEKDEYLYKVVKRFCYRIGAPSQVITASLLRRLQDKAFWKVLSGLCGKLMPQRAPDGRAGMVFPHPWNLEVGPLDSHRSTVCLSVSTYMQSRRGAASDDNGATIGWGVAATTNAECSGIIQDFGSLRVTDHVGILTRIDVILAKLFKRLYFQQDRKFENIVIYRRGVSEGLIPRLVAVEIPAVYKSLEDITGAYTYDADRKTFTITWPSFLKENGEYEVRLEAAAAGGEPATFTTTLKRTRRIDNTKVAYLELDLSGESRELNLDAAPSLKGPGMTTFTVMPSRPRICYIVVNKSSNASLMTFKDAERQGGNPRQDPMLTPGGTLIDSFFKCIPQGVLDEFYIVPGSGPVGFALPVHYIIVQNDMELTLQEISDMTLRMSFLYFNNQSSNKMPHIVRISETAAEQALNVYRDIEQEVEADCVSVFGHNVPGEHSRLKDTAIFL